MKDGPLTERYTVTHKHGAPVDPDKRYFVLAVDTDPGAIPALRAYVDAIMETHPELATSMIEAYGLMPQRKPLHDAQIVGTGFVLYRDDEIDRETDSIVDVVQWIESGRGSHETSARLIAATYTNIISLGWRPRVSKYDPFTGGASGSALKNGYDRPAIYPAPKEGYKGYVMASAKSRLECALRLLVAVREHESANR